jgi:hypothetical protein
MFNEKQTNLTLDNVYLMQALQLGILSTHVHLTAKAEWQVNVRNFIAAVDTLESLTMGDLINDKKYLRRVKNLALHAEKKYKLHEIQNTSNRVRKNDFGMTLSFEVAQRKLGLIMRSLLETGKLRNRTIVAIDDMPSGSPNNWPDLTPESMNRIISDLQNAGQIPATGEERPVFETTEEEELEEAIPGLDILISELSDELPEEPEE